MTNDSIEVHADSQVQATPKKTITLELLDQAGITLHYDDLVDAVKTSVPDCTPWTVAHSMMAIRGKQLLAWAIWVGERIQGVFITQPVSVGFAGDRGMFIYALRGNELEMDQWSEVIDQFSGIARRLNYTRLLAMTKNPRILEIVTQTGWTVSSFCEREI